MTSTKVDELIAKAEEVADGVLYLTEDEHVEFTRRIDILKKQSKVEVANKIIENEDDYWDRLRMAYRNTPLNLPVSERWRLAYNLTK